MHSDWWRSCVFTSQCWCEKDISSSPAHTPSSALAWFPVRLQRGFQLRPFHLALTQLHLFTATHNSFPLKCPPVLLWVCSRGAGWKPFERRPLPAEVLLAWKLLSLWMEASLTRLVRGSPLSHSPRGPCQTSYKQNLASSPNLGLY